MSRFRLNPALVISAMVNGTIEPTRDDATGTMLRETKMQMETAHSRAAHGCRAAGCRQFVRCICGCRRCKVECTYRDAIARVDGTTVYVEHANGEGILKLTTEEYEALRKINPRLPTPCQSELTRW